MDSLDPCLTLSIGVQPGFSELCPPHCSSLPLRLLTQSSKHGVSGALAAALLPLRSKLCDPLPIVAKQRWFNDSDPSDQSTLFGALSSGEATLVNFLLLMKHERMKHVDYPCTMLIRGPVLLYGKASVKSNGGSNLFGFITAPLSPGAWMMLLLSACCFKILNRLLHLGRFQFALLQNLIAAQLFFYAQNLKATVIQPQRGQPLIRNLDEFVKRYRAGQLQLIINQGYPCSSLERLKDSDLYGHRLIHQICSSKRYRSANGLNEVIKILSTEPGTITWAVTGLRSLSELGMVNIGSPPLLAGCGISKSLRRSLLSESITMNCQAMMAMISEVKAYE